jgi:hypothetical protein
MNRSTFILGFTLLVTAATLAVSISLRNEPGDAVATSRPARRQAQAQAHPAALPADFTGSRQEAPTIRKSGALRVELPEPWLDSLPGDQQAAWRTRAGAVQSNARAELERLTNELDLSAAQRDKIFPALVRSASGYDPVMLVGGSPIPSTTSLAALEDIHQVLDPQQQARVEDQEVNRQLWWQDTLSRLEADLIESTGGVPAAQPAPVDSLPATEQRVAPQARESGNLFELLQP